MTKQTAILARGLGVIGATAVLVTGVTFAALSSNTATLADNEVSVATAGLQVSTDNANYGSSEPGFHVTNLAPGATSGAHNFYLKNTGGVPLLISATTANTSGLDQIDQTKVHINIVAVNGDSSQSGSITLAQLETSPQSLPGPSVAAGGINTYTFTVSMDSDVTGGGTTKFDVVFSGSQDTNNTPAPTVQ